MMKSNKKHTVSVTFAGDDDIVQHIISEETRSHGRRQRDALSYSTSKSSSRKTDASSDEEEAFGHSEVLAAVEEGEAVLLGSNVFQFKSRGKSGMMIQRASECKTPSKVLLTPTSKKSKIKSDKSSKKEESNGHATPKKREKRPETTTPYRLRKRNIADDEMSDSGDDSSESELESSPQQQSSTRKKRTDPEESATNAEAYFDLHSGGGVTSENTLSKLDTPRLDTQSLNELLKFVSFGHTKEIKETLAEYKSLFCDWMVQMCNGFNILLYGLGSKRSLMDDFRSSYLQNFNHIVVNGYFPSLTIKHIYQSIAADVLNCEANCRTVLDQYELIRKHFEEGEYEDFYIMIHNIDGATLRGEKTQNHLSLLAQIRGIHLIASVDHINAPLVWDNVKCSRYNWLWFDATTFVNYTAETSYENSLLVQRTGALALSSLTHVMRSLTPNAKGIFMLLAKYQLENTDNPNFIGMPFTDLYQRCGEAFLVNSDLTLRAQLTEFHDHKLVKSKKSYDGAELLNIPIDAATLAEFVEQHENS